MGEASTGAILQGEKSGRRYGLLCVVVGWVLLAGMFTGYSFLAYAASWVDSPWANYGYLAKEARNCFAVVVVISLLLGATAIILRPRLAGLLLFTVAGAVGVWGVFMNLMTAMAGRGYPYFDF
ncbi:hypothetical protein [Paraburkholderia graminis]|uniref:hypothetical protein n=1 Tax=Paraburkholderia graminis TaxID=60548 RepID=UPI0038BB8171